LEKSVSVKIRTKQKSSRGESTFAWNSALQEAKLTKYPKTCLKKNVNLRPYIQQSQILQIVPANSNDSLTQLESFLEGKNCGFLDPNVISGEMLSPLVLMIIPDKDGNSLMGFCVDYPEDNNREMERKDLIKMFRNIFQENVKLAGFEGIVPPVAIKRETDENVDVKQVVLLEDQNKETDTKPSIEHDPFANLVNPQTDVSVEKNEVLLSTTIKTEIETSDNQIKDVLSTTSSVKVKANVATVSSQNFGIVNRNNDLEAEDVDGDLEAGNGDVGVMNGDLESEVMDSELKSELEITENLKSEILPLKCHLESSLQLQWNFKVFDTWEKYTALFIENKDVNNEEQIIYFNKSWNGDNLVPNLMDDDLYLDSVDDNHATLSHPKLPKDLQVTIIKDLSHLEQNILMMGTEQTGNVNLINIKTLHGLLTQLEIKHNCEVMIIPKIEKVESSTITTVITCKDDLKRIEEYKEQEKKKADPVETVPRKTYNPDEIINGRPKWAKITKKDPKTGEETTIEFDRLNPHRTQIEEFDQMENNDDQFQKVGLTMMADFQSETLVTLGDAKLKPEDDQKYVKEYQEWEDCKKRNDVDVDDDGPPTKRKKIQVMKNKVKDNIISRPLRKDPLPS